MILEQLSYIDNNEPTIILLLDNNIIEKHCEVYHDVNNKDREYIVINYEIIYLDTMKKIFEKYQQGLITKVKYLNALGFFKLKDVENSLKDSYTGECY